MSRAKKILLALLVVFIAIQFIQPAHNKTVQVLPTDFAKVFVVPNNVQSVLQIACYDCHSNNTRYPWYTNIQPAGWLLANHVKDGKEELNFSEFANNSQRKQLSKLKATQNSIKDGSMPLPSYTLIHTDAKLSKESKAVILNWTSKVIDSLSRQ